MKILLSIVFLFVFFVTNANTTNIEKQQAQQIVYKIIYKMNQFSGTKMPKQLVYKFINNEIFPLFDFDYMSQEIIKSLPNNVKNNAIVYNIKNDISNTIAQTLLKSRGRVFVPIGVRSSGDTLILTIRVKNTKVNLAMHNTQNSWKIFDIAMENQGLLNYYKQLLHR